MSSPSAFVLGLGLGAILIPLFELIEALVLSRTIPLIDPDS